MCTGANSIGPILAGTHGPPTITPMPGSDPCTENITCDSTRYNQFVITFYIGDTLVCGGGTVDDLNNFYSPFQCDTKNSGLFIDSFAVPAPDKAILCYCDPTMGACQN